MENSNTQSISESFRLSILKMMDSKNISKGAFAEMLGVNPSYVTKLLKKGNNYTIKTINKISSVLECNVEVILTEGNINERKTD